MHKDLITLLRLDLIDLRFYQPYQKNPVTDLDNTNFIEIAEIRNGVVRETNSNTQYNPLSDELARRTYDESGDYYVKPFSVFCKESLNDGINNEEFLMRVN